MPQHLACLTLLFASIASTTARADDPKIAVDELSLGGIMLRMDEAEVDVKVCAVDAVCRG
ncbi:hypothetical protein [Arenimonas composti]|uniref:Uncharacterized protein n=1 Tax=Arenimonas composti TR7-09 = DSM 18010 TaxID=1121013 RepID=A0A091BF45_9GAMM|nr:hypothetical protein [Arenimonas composti]KFN50167.1 hypothetical protein P873_07980 [Arenimonas composti TR7-09 = DSM 18010]